MNSTDPLSKLQKATPAYLLKQLKATAALMCYNHVFSFTNMPTQELHSKIYNIYDGNEDLNMISQVELMYEGKDAYSNMYNCV